MIYRIFISHRWRYDDYRRLVRLLDNGTTDFSWQNYSVGEDRQFTGRSWSKMATALRDQIQRVHAVLVVAGLEAHYSEWVQTELQIATEWYNKPLVWIRPAGASRIPAFAHEVADEIVGWSHRSVVSGIKRAIRDRRPDLLCVG